LAQITPQIKDGGIGTTLLTLKNGENSVYCTDLLNLEQPEQVKKVHQQFLDAGADLLTSNTFCCDQNSLKGSGYEGRLEIPSQKGAELARLIAGTQATVLGSLGPGWKSPSRQEVSFKSLENSYYQRSLGLLKGKVDILWIETVQDPLQAEAAVLGALRAQTQLQIKCPIAVLISGSQDGKNTGDFTTNDLLNELDKLPADILGVNCSFSPVSLQFPLNWLRENSTKKIAACPNAGLPQNRLNPIEFSQELITLWQNFQPDIIGGCCGVSPKHIQTLKQYLSK